jgi:hypothetical protein
MVEGGHVMKTGRKHPESIIGRNNHGAAALAFVGSALLVLFWVLYFSGILEFGTSDPVMTEFEAAFPFADAMLASILFIAGIGLRKGHRLGGFCLTGGAAMALYLGILDLTFYARQGMYAPLRSEGAVELAVNLLCIVGGVVALGFSWKLERGQS